MKLLKTAFALGIAVISTAGFAHADGGAYYHVPFQDVPIQAGTKIYADYSFDSHNQIMVCRGSDPSTLTTIKWIYKDVSLKSLLPVSLNDNMIFKGKIADPNGTIEIENKFGPDQTVSCDYINRV